MRLLIKRLRNRTFILVLKFPGLKGIQDFIFSSHKEKVQKKIFESVVQGNLDFQAESQAFGDIDSMEKVVSFSHRENFNFSSVHVDELHHRLGLSAPLNYPHTSLAKPLTQWKMEIDDSPIFRYLYRNLQPKRHLEFGTWHGTGVLYCLEECEATVWTINILNGESDLDGNWAYTSHLFFPNWAKDIPFWAKSMIFEGSRPTDSLGMIGRFYLEKDLGNRVCQIYCDSVNWDISHYPEGFFDSVLIDGGHTEDVVFSDTQNALKLLRSGGVVLWHDFCPNLEVYQNFTSSRGVYDAIIKNYGWIASQLKDIFWINPSWILLGIKK